MKTDDLDERPDRDPGGNKGKVMMIVAIVVMVGLLVILYLAHGIQP